MGTVFHESVWLYGNLTWQRISSLPDYPQPGHLLYAFPAALALTILRYLCESLVFIPLGHALGLKSPVVSLRPNVILERAFRSQVDQSKIKQLAVEVRWTIKEVEIWLRQRRKLNKCSTLKKFSESGWRFTFYTCIAVYATSFLSKKPWLWNTSLLFEKTPELQELTSDVWWYYIIELGFYLSLMASQFTDVSRKDFKMMMLHHVYTFVLMSGTWCTNSVRVGTLVTFIHDFSDIPLELAKCMTYLKFEKTSLGFFILFTTVWIVTRIAVYPYYVYISWRDSYPFVSFTPYLILNSLLLALLALHIIWTKMIFQTAFRAITKNEKRDSRSDTEESSLSEDDTKSK